MLIAGLGTGLTLAATSVTPAWASPADGLIPDLRGSAAWSMLFGWEGTEMPDGAGHRLVMNKESDGANYSISLAQARVAGKIDASYLVAMRDIYSPLEIVTEYETRLDELLGSLAGGLGLSARQTQDVRRLVHWGSQAEGRKSYHLVTGKLIFHCAGYLPTSVTQGWTLTILSVASDHQLARTIVGQIRSQNAKKDKIRLNDAAKLRKARSWRVLYALGQAWVRELPESPHAWMTLGEAAVETGKHKEAIAAFSQGLRFVKGNATQHRMLAYAQAMTRKWKEAVASYKRALHLAPRDAEALWNLGVCYGYLNDYGGIRDVHLRMIGVNPILADEFQIKLVAQIDQIQQLGQLSQTESP
jgi:tetratricopeptide (TPR) repeat protein